MSRLDKDIEGFYLAILDYAGMELDDHEVVVNKNNNLGDISLDDKPIALPYFETLKNPQGKTIFHLLNESYPKPETALFALYKDRLTLEINLRLSDLFTDLISVASDTTIQRKIKSPELLEIVTTIGEVDVSILEGILKAFRAAAKENNTGYIVDFFLKKNGMFNEVPYAAIGKVTFKTFNEIASQLEETGGDYNLYGTKLRKKDLLALYGLYRAVFPHIDDQDAYTETTDNKAFRYLNILLKTTYLVSARINHIASLLDALKVSSLDTSRYATEDTWVNYLEPLYKKVDAIRLIPNQTDIISEAKRLNVDETNVKNVQQVQQPVPQQQVAQQVPQPPQFQPQQLQQQQQMQQQPAQQQVATEPSSPNDILYALRNQGGAGQVGNMGYQQPMMNPMQFQQPMQMQMPVQQAPLPQWMLEEQMKQQMQQQAQMQAQMQPQMQMQMPMHPMQMGMGYPQPMQQMQVPPPMDGSMSTQQRLAILGGGRSGYFR